MLQGTFDIFTLPELLGMLTGGSKTGTLVVERGPAAGRIHLRDGLCCGVEPPGPVADDAALTDALATLCFDLLREHDGTFEFLTDEPPASERLVTVDEALTEADRRIEEWKEVCALVPSLDVCPQLSPQINGERITLSAAEWELAVTLDGRVTVRELVDLRRQSLLDICREVAALVERGAIRLNEQRHVGVPVSSASGAAAGGPEGFTPPPLVPVAPYGPGVEDAPAAEVAEPEPAAETEPAAAEVAEPVEAPVVEVAESVDAGAGPVDDGSPADPTGDDDDFFEEIAGEAAVGGGDGDEVKDRGALLRMFSALRES